MALIPCKYCEKDISDKATNCPHCGGVLLEDTLATGCVDEVALCQECGADISEDVTLCHNCGCPISSHEEEETAQKVELTAVKLQVKKTTKKIVVIGVIIAVLLAFLVSIVVSNSKKNAAEEYISNVKTTAYTMLSGAADAEKACNLIKSVWYNAIYEKQDTETDPYTRPDGYFYDDFNDALGKLFSDSAFTEQISAIKDHQKMVSKSMKELKNPPEEHQEAYEALKEYYDAYLALTNLATNPTGSLQSFSNEFNDADTKVLNCLKAVELYFED